MLSVIFTALISSGTVHFFCTCFLHIHTHIYTFFSFGVWFFLAILNIEFLMYYFKIKFVLLRNRSGINF